MFIMIIQQVRKEEERKTNYFFSLRIKAFINMCWL
jgi:hypothetical protein